jgi:hypothetical protein
MTATTFAALPHGASFTFVNSKLAYAGTTLVDTTTYKKTGSFSFTAGHGVVTLHNVKTLKVTPVPPSFLF